MHDVREYLETRMNDKLNWLEEAYQKHLEHERWSEMYSGKYHGDPAHLDGCFFCGSMWHPSDCCPDEYAQEEYWGHEIYYSDEPIGDYEGECANCGDRLYEQYQDCSCTIGYEHEYERYDW